MEKSKVLDASRCPDCGGTLKQIKVFARGWKNQLGAAVDAELKYFTSPDAKRSTFLVMFQEEGQIRSYVCEGCKRVLFYAE